MGAKDHTLRLAAFVVCLIVVFGVIRGLMKRGDSLSTRSVPELVKLYWSAPGADDAVGPEFARRGAPARDELIRMLDATLPPKLDSNETADIVAILESRFPSQASSEALDRLRSRVTNPMAQSELRSRLAVIRAKMSGQWNEAWWKEDRTMSPREQNLHYEELLMANAAPGDRVLFLVEVARIALEIGKEAKAEAYAREILETPDLAAKSGDGVYYGNHVLGMIALKRGDIDGAKRYLIESGKSPGSWELNGLRPPDTDLAVALLARGERDAVFEYLDHCKVFSKKDQLIESWKATIRAGGVPDFRTEWTAANLPPKQRAIYRQMLKEGGPHGL